MFVSYLLLLYFHVSFVRSSYFDELNYILPVHIFLSLVNPMHDSCDRALKAQSKAAAEAAAAATTTELVV